MANGVPFKEASVELQIKQLRKKSHISQTELANSIGVSLRTVGSWEREESLPNAEQVWNCAVSLGCSPNDICGWYIDHPEDRPAPPGDPGAAELLGCYRSCTPERQDALLNLARDSALLSGGAAERGAVSEAV